MRGNEIPEILLRVIKESSHCLLLTHTQPDGDALGSLLGMADLLEQMGKRVFAYLDEPISHLYDFLPGCQRPITDIDRLQDFVDEAGPDICAIALDCGEANRLGPHHGRFLGISPFLVVDHHLSHGKFGDQRWVDTRRSSTGEMVFEIGQALGQIPTYEAALALYVAICTDTGSFRYECTGARTFEIAGRLVELGVRPDQVARLLYDNYSFERLKLVQMVLSTLELSEDSRIAAIHVTREMFERSGARAQDVEGIIEYVRGIGVVRVAVFFKETRSGGISISLRGKGDCNVAAIAEQFGGGGHRNAAGCKIPDQTIDSVRAKVLPSIQSALAQSGPAPSC